MSERSERKRGSRAGLQIQPFPIEDPLASLPKTAQKILAAAQKLLAERGYEAVTLENVAAEAGVNKASIRYNFGNKAGSTRPSRQSAA
jgi:AcrR family transcriptional regulator